MKTTEIKAGRSYLNKSGRAERHVLDIGLHIHPTWFGSELTRPVGEPGVLVVDTRMGKTFYGRSSGKCPFTMYLSAFASWAREMVPEGDEAPYPIVAETGRP